MELLWIHYSSVCGNPKEKQAVDRKTEQEKGKGVKACVVVGKKLALKGVALLGGVASLCVTVGVGFEASYMLKSHPVSQFTSGCLKDVQFFQLLLQHYVCLHATMSHHEANRQKNLWTVSPQLNAIFF